MDRTTFESQMTEICAKALVAGLIELEQFGQLLQYVKMPLSSGTKPLRAKRKVHGVLLDWQLPMIDLVCQLHLEGMSDTSIASEMVRRFDVRPTWRAVNTFIANVVSGRILDKPKYQQEPLRTAVQTWHRVLNEKEKGSK